MQWEWLKPKKITLDSWFLNRVAAYNVKLTAHQLEALSLLDVYFQDEVLKIIKSSQDKTNGNQQVQDGRAF
jgi:hypothetical protein